MKGLFIGFICLQIVVDLAHSVSFFPFVHYGMFSQTISREDSVEAFEVTVDGQRLKPADFLIYQWDMVMTPLQAVEQQTQTGDYAFDKEKLREGLQRVGLGAVYKLVTPNLDNTGQFPEWYRSFLSGLVGHPIQRLEVEKTWYQWAGGRLVVVKRAPYIHL
jgi:hypothetical protein